MVTADENAVILDEICRRLKPLVEIVQIQECQSDRLVLEVNGRSLILSCDVHEGSDSKAEVAHAHVLIDNERRDFHGFLDACVVGVDTNRQSALKSAAAAWISNAAPPIFSFFHEKPVLTAENFDCQKAWGLEHVQGYVGNFAIRGWGPQRSLEELVNPSLFEDAMEIAPPGTVHLVKVTLTVERGRWRRIVEVDGHMASFSDVGWGSQTLPPQQAVGVCFLTIQLVNRPDLIQMRRDLDRAIFDYIEIFDRERDRDRTKDELIRLGCQVLIADRVHQFLPLGLGRALVTQNTSLEPTKFYRRIRPSAEILPETRLMSEPAFARGFALAHQLAAGQFAEAVKELALCSAEVIAINNALNEGCQLEDAVMAPILAPDFDTGQDAVDEALKTLDRLRTTETQAKRPWWKFWS